MSAKMMAASRSKRRSGCRVTLAASSGLPMMSSMP